MKKISLQNILATIIFLCMSLVAPSTTMAISSETREFIIEGRIFNAVTGEYVSDSVRVDVLTPDITLVATDYNRFYDELQYAPDDERQYLFRVTVKAEGEDFILRLSFPDYATVCYPIAAKSLRNDVGRLKMRRLTRFEKATMLGEVTVKASVLQVVNKGDTIQFNADAFDLAKGSMLDALIEQMPGVELRDGGRIYVNGRFVDKLLLDGKDFFQGDQFVLLQNLPAYTVKNVKVYEQASASKEVFGRDDPNDPNKYVMDVALKKGYNTGWMANAEAGGGTHDRYRGRAFGVGFTNKWRVGAFGFMNNLNETRNPGRDGDWSPADSKAGLTASKAGGVSYGYFSPDRHVEVTGLTNAQYAKTNKNTLTNTQNFLSGGDTYRRRWSGDMERTVSVKSDNTVALRPREGNRYNQTFALTAAFSNGQTGGDITEGTFSTPIADRSDLRDKLRNGWLDGMSLLNRFLSEYGSNSRQFNGEFYSSTNLSLPRGNGLTLLGVISYNNSRTYGNNFNNYLIQYAGENAVANFRSNPKKSHEYRYNVAASWFRTLGPYFTVIPRIDFFAEYHYNRNNWLTDTDTTSTPGDIAPSMRTAAMMLLDPRNSYEARSHYTNIRPWISLSFRKRFNNGNLPSREISAFISAKANIRRDWMTFNGFTTNYVNKKYVSPETSLGSTVRLHNFTHQIQFSYNIQGTTIDPFNLVDVMFDYDPLNLRIGNPGLKQSISHSWRLFYFNSNWMLDRIRMYVDFNYSIIHNQTAMSYAYDRSTGVRTYRPVNVNGNRYGSFTVGPTIALDRAKRLQLVDYFKIEPRRSVDMTSTDAFASSQKSVVNSLYFSEYLSLEYNANKFMAAFDSQFETRRTSSADGFFDPFRITQVKYGVRGRVTLPADFEVSTDLKMYSTRGFDYHEMNTNQLVWNARITKTLLDGRLMLFLDGYDILGRVKNISYQVNEQGRTETWVNNIPSYAMLSLRWNFAKKPRE